MKILKFSLLIGIVAVFFHSCNKQEFEKEIPVEKPLPYSVNENGIMVFETAKDYCAVTDSIFNQGDNGIVAFGKENNFKSFYAFFLEAEAIINNSETEIEFRNNIVKFSNYVQFKDSVITLNSNYPCNTPVLDKEGFVIIAGQLLKYSGATRNSTSFNKFETFQAAKLFLNNKIKLKSAKGEVYPGKWETLDYERTIQYSNNRRSTLEYNRGIEFFDNGNGTADYRPYFTAIGSSYKRKWEPFHYYFDSYKTDHWIKMEGTYICRNGKSNSILGVWVTRDNGRTVMTESKFAWTDILDIPNEYVLMDIDVQVEYTHQGMNLNWNNYHDYSLGE